VVPWIRFCSSPFVLSSIDDYKGMNERSLRIISERRSSSHDCGRRCAARGFAVSKSLHGRK
jgi:hypothetical protein